MQTTNLDLQKMGLTPMTTIELQQVEGGLLKTIVKIAALAVAAGNLIITIVSVASGK